MALDADGIRAEVLRLAADDAWLDRIGSGSFRYADGGHNPFLVKFVGMNGPEALADFAERTSIAVPRLRGKWLRAIGPERKRDAKGKFVFKGDG